MKHIGAIFIKWKIFVPNKYFQAGWYRGIISSLHYAVGFFCRSLQKSCQKGHPFLTTKTLSKRGVPFDNVWEVVKNE